MAASGTKIFNTVLIFLVFLSKGLYIELAGPVMIDLKLIFNTSYASLTKAVSGRGIGGILGSLLGGVIADKFQRRLDLCTGTFCVVAAAVLSYIPIAPSIDYLWFMYFGIGMSSSVLNICCTRLILDMWKESNTSILQLIHMGYGTGALLTPLICAPFLATVEFSSDNSFKVVKESRVQIPFFGIALFTLMLSLPFLFRSCKFNRDVDVGVKKKDVEAKPILPTKIISRQRLWREMINPATYANGRLYYGSLIIGLMVVYYFNLIGCEKVFANFVRTFSVEALKFNKNQASYLNTLFWVSFTLGRFFVSIISHFLPVSTIITLVAMSHLGSVTFLKYYASGTVNLFWIGTFIEGFVVSPLYGLGLSFGSTQIEISGMILTVFLFAQNLGDWTYLKTSGRMFDTRGPSAILDLMNVAAWLITGTVVVLLICGRKAQSVK